MMRGADLFQFAGERAAIASGFSAEAHRLELLHPTPAEPEDPFGIFWCICGGRIGKDPLGTCKGCGK